MRRIIHAINVVLVLALPVQAGTTLLLGAGAGTSSTTCDSSWVLAASGVKASLDADFTTEGTTNHYWFNSTCYSSAAAWMSAIGATSSRAGAAYYNNSSGLLASAATNVLRFNYNPATLTSVGVLQETAATNLALWARDLTQSGTWIATTMTTALTSTGADGTATSATRLTATAPLATILQTPGLSSTTRTYSVYMRRVTGSGTIKLSADGTTFTADLSGQLNNTTYTRLSVTQNTVPIVGIQIGTSGDAVDVDFNQLEAGAATVTPTTPILTTNATAARAGDVAILWAMPFTGFSTTVGTVVYFSATSSGTSGSLAPWSFANVGGGNIGRIVSVTNTSTGANGLRVEDPGIQAQISITGGNTTAYAVNKIGGVWALNDFAALFNGGTVATDNSGTVPTSLDTAIIGGSAAGAGANASVPANMLRWAYWPSRVSNADMQTLTTP